MRVRCGLLLHVLLLCRCCLHHASIREGLRHRWLRRRVRLLLQRLVLLRRWRLHGLRLWARLTARSRLLLLLLLLLWLLLLLLLRRTLRRAAAPALLQPHAAGAALGLAAKLHAHLPAKQAQVAAEQRHSILRILHVLVLDEAEPLQGMASGARLVPVRTIASDTAAAPLHAASWCVPPSPSRPRLVDGALVHRRLLRQRHRHDGARLQQRRWQERLPCCTLPGA